MYKTYEEVITSQGAPMVHHVHIFPVPVLADFLILKYWKCCVQSQRFVDNISADSTIEYNKLWKNKEEKLLENVFVSHRPENYENILEEVYISSLTNE